MIWWLSNLCHLTQTSLWGFLDNSTWILKRYFKNKWPNKVIDFNPTFPTPTPSNLLTFVNDSNILGKNTWDHPGFLFSSHSTPDLSVSSMSLSPRYILHHYMQPPFPGMYPSPSHILLAQRLTMLPSQPSFPSPSPSCPSSMQQPFKKHKVDSVSHPCLNPTSLPKLWGFLLCLWPGPLLLSHSPLHEPHGPLQHFLLFMAFALAVSSTQKLFSQIFSKYQHVKLPFLCMCFHACCISPQTPTPP